MSNQPQESLAGSFLKTSSFMAVFGHPLAVTFARPVKLFTGTAGGPPATSTARCDDSQRAQLHTFLFALRAHGGRAARGPSEELEWANAGNSQHPPNSKFLSFSETKRRT